MTFIETVDPEKADGAIAKVYEAAQQRSGGIANIIRTMSQDGKSAGASMMFYAALMKSENALSGAQREMLATVVSQVNDCFY